MSKRSRFKNASVSKRFRQEKRAQRLSFWVRRPPGGVGVFHAKGWWPKTSCPPSKLCLPWVSKRGIRDVPGILPGCPGPLAVFKKFVQKNFVRIFRSLKMSEASLSIGRQQTLVTNKCLRFNATPVGSSGGFFSQGHCFSLMTELARFFFSDLKVCSSSALQQPERFCEIWLIFASSQKKLTQNSAHSNILHKSATSSLFDHFAIFWKNSEFCSSLSFLEIP